MTASDKPDVQIPGDQSPSYQLEVEDIEDEGVARILVRMRDQRIAVGAFLNPEDRRTFARAFGAALAAARH